MVGKKVNKDDVGLGAGPPVFFPLPQDPVDFGRQRLTVDDLRVFSRHLEGFGNGVRVALPDEPVRVEMCSIDLL